MAAGKGSIFANDVLAYFFQQTAPTYASNANFYMALHTADPNLSSPSYQGTSEATYTGYARIAIPRSSAGFTIVNNLISNTAIVLFATCTGGNNTITNWSWGVSSSSSTGEIIYTGFLAVPIIVTAGIQPEFAAGVLQATES